VHINFLILSEALRKIIFYFLAGEAGSFLFLNILDGDFKI